MKIINKQKFFWFFLIIFLLASKISFSAGDKSLEVILFPQYPAPNEEVSVELASFSLAIDSSKTKIIINDEIIKDEIGVRKFNFKTGPAGSKTKIDIETITAQGEVVNQTIFVIPNSVKLIYELNDAFKPMLYQGKSRVISNSDVSVMAVPNFYNEEGKKIPANALIYNWYINYSLEQDNSGFGKNIYRIDRLDAFPQETRISVKVMDLSKKLIAEDWMYLRPKHTEVQFYLLNPSLPFIFWNNIKNNIVSPYLENNILAIPYFMNRSDEEINFSWFVNGELYREHNGKVYPFIKIINSPENFVGKIKLSIELLNRYRFLQSVQKEVEILFSENSINDDKELILFKKGRVEESL